MKLTPPYPDPVLKFVAITPKITASFSLLGVSYMIWHICRNQKLRQQPYHRLLLSMSIQDWLFSWRCFASTWAVPAHLDGIYGNVGNHTTCTMAGFVGQATAVSSALYNGSLAMYFLLTIVYSWTDHRYQKSGLEWFFHGVPLMVGWGTAIAALGMDMYHSIGWTCWIAPGPGVTAKEPHNILAYRWAFFFAQVWTVFCVTAVVLALIYCHIRKLEHRMLSYQFSPSTNSDTSQLRTSTGFSIETHTGNSTASSTSTRVRNDCQRQRSLSKRFATQSYLYVAAYFLAYVFPLVMFHLSVRTGQFYAPLLMALVVFLPLQGFFDAAIYLRPRYLAYREEQARERELRVRQQDDEAALRSSILPDRVAAIVHILSTPDDISDEYGIEPTHNVSDEASGSTGQQEAKKVNVSPGQSSLPRGWRK